MADPARGPVVHAVTNTKDYVGYNVHAREFFGGLSQYLPVTCAQWMQSSPYFGAATVQDCRSSRDVLRDR